MFDFLTNIMQEGRVWAIEQVLWAEKNLAGHTGKEKRAAIVAKLDDMIKLPSYLEWADDMILGYLIDVICSKLNILTDKDFANVELSNDQKAQIASVLELSDTEISKAQGQTLKERLASLIK